jgi:hypothetical protein
MGQKGPMKSAEKKSRDVIPVAFMVARRKMQKKSRLV